jgi:hypothetical protein
MDFAMIRTLTIAAVAALLTASTLPASAQKILQLGIEEYQAKSGMNCNRDMCVKQGLGISGTMKDMSEVLERAHENHILTRVQVDAYAKRLDAIKTSFEQKKNSGEKPTFEELDWTAKELSALADDINRKLNINQPMLAVNPDYLNEQYDALKVRVSGALNIGRLDGGTAKFYRSEAKKIVASVDKNDTKSIEDASRQLARLTSKLQIATARSRGAQANASTSTSSSYLLGPRAF